MSDRERIGRYEIVSPISQGGMGSVYLARDPQLNRQVAVKLLLDTLNNEEWRRRFHREARALAQLAHPNIVTIFDFGEDDRRRPFIVMEYVRGRHLGELIEAGLPLVEKLVLLEKLCAGLDCAHQAGIAHLDIKPANLIVEPGGRLTIVDFGIARSLDGRATLPDVRSGTPSYMAPEQITGEAIGPHTDQFAAGAVAYELLSGRRAFEGSLREVATKICAVDPPPLSQACPGIDPALEGAVTRALSKQAVNRFPSMAAMGRSLGLIRERLDSRNQPTVPSIAARSGLTTIDAPFPANRVASVDASGVARGQTPEMFRGSSAETDAPQPMRRTGFLWAAAAAAVVIGLMLFASTRRGEAPPTRPAETARVPERADALPPPTVSQSEPPQNAVTPTPVPPRNGSGVPDARHRPTLDQIASLFAAGGRDVLGAVESALAQYPGDPELTGWLVRVESRARDAAGRQHQTATARTATEFPSFSQAVQAEREAVEIDRQGDAARATRKFWEAEELFALAVEAAADRASAPAPERSEVDPEAEGAIRAALQALAGAYANLSGAAVKAAYPGLRADEARTLDRNFLDYSAFRLDVQIVRIAYQGTRAMATCTLESMVTLRNGSQRRATTSASFTLEKSDRSWRIVSASRLPS